MPKVQIATKTYCDDLNSFSKIETNRFETQTAIVASINGAHSKKRTS